MRKEFLHFPTCPVWVVNAVQACTCKTQGAWVIREDVTQQYPWRVFRLTGDGEQEIMGCSTAEGAAELVQSFKWLQAHALRRNNVV